MNRNALKGRLLRLVRGTLRYSPMFLAEVAVFWLIRTAVDYSGYGSPSPVTRPATWVPITVALVVLAMGAAEARFHLYRRVWSVAGLNDAFAVGLAVVEASLLITLANLLFPDGERPLRILAPIFAAPMVVIGIGLLRLIPRLRTAARPTGNRLLVVIPDASGYATVRALLQHPSPDWAPVAVVTTGMADVGRTVMVTGAAGSIGAELCRLLAGMGPKRLVLVDINESGLFDLAEELRVATAVDLREALVSIVDRELLLRVFSEERPDVVFHAAAYKHVPMLEAHPIQAVLANVTGTWNTLRCAHAAGVKRFILISTDKAVAKHSVMGCTKRLCEQIVLAYTGPMSCWAGRFGNVVGSRGSVVPLFERQIEQGGPVTITHPEVSRFMMTIREAASPALGKEEDLAWTVERLEGLAREGRSDELVRALKNAVQDHRETPEEPGMPDRAEQRLKDQESL